MGKIIAHCGLDCSKCDAYVARKKGDQVLRESAAKKWEKLYGYDGLAPSDIDCDGCLSESGVTFMNCKICPIRICAKERNMGHCTECVDFPCNNIKIFHSNHPEAKRNLEKI